MSRQKDQVRVAQLDPNAEFRGPFRSLSEAQRQAWDDVVAACPDGVLRACDEIFVDVVACQLSSWRHLAANPQLASDLVDLASMMRLLYRMLGQLLVPMPERRRLLFPDRPKRRHLQ
jgi:hypothetical protein